ncbi:MAG: hypothetical protein ACKV2U_10460 [Bryobacteraceae bacterium]
MRILSALPPLISISAADWNLEKAAACLDARQIARKDFKPAKDPHGTCASRHTGLGYILLRRTLHQAAPTAMESNLYSSLRGRLAANEKTPAEGIAAAVESILDPALAWTGVKDTGCGCSLGVLGFDALTRPKSFHRSMNLVPHPRAVLPKWLTLSTASLPRG